jgi:ribosomal protein L7/L12
MTTGPWGMTLKGPKYILERGNMLPEIPDSRILVSRSVWQAMQTDMEATCNEVFKLIAEKTDLLDQIERLQMELIEEKARIKLSPPPHSIPTDLEVAERNGWLGKIAAIKLLRRLNDMGLKEAKYYVEQKCPSCTVYRNDGSSLQVFWV